MKIGGLEVYFSQLIRQAVAGEDIAQFDLCRVGADGRLLKTNSLSVNTMPGLFLALDTVAIGGAGDFLRRGLAINPAWAWTVGGFVYAGNVAGTLTQVLPFQSGEQLQIVGIATAVNQIDFDPNLLLIEVA